MSSRAPVALLATALLAALAACGDGGGGERLFSPQGNQLDVYDLETDEATLLIPSDRNTVNGQACALPNGDGNFLMGEDTNQPEERMGWGIFAPDGTLVQKIPEPVSEGEKEQPEPYGCGFDGEERLFVTDVGDGSFDAKNGKLIVFFPPDYEDFCILATDLRTAGMIAIDDDGAVYVTESVPPGRVLSFAPPFPSSPGECATVEPGRSIFIEDPDVQTPIGITRAPNGNWYVSSVLIPAAVREYDTEGNFVRVIVEGEDIGNPAGLDVASDGPLYYADLGLVEQPPPDFFGPGSGRGTVRRVSFDADGNPQPPEIIASGLDYPDAVSVLPD
jgi:hypothetical protein